MSETQKLIPEIEAELARMREQLGELDELQKQMEGVEMELTPELAAMLARLEELGDALAAPRVAAVPTFAIQG